MGVAVSACDEKKEVEVSLNQGDAVVYAAKENGRNRWIEHCTSAARKTAAGRVRKRLDNQHSTGQIKHGEMVAFSEGCEMMAQPRERRM
jgi:hypothetical protein